MDVAVVAVSGRPTVPSTPAVSVVNTNSLLRRGPMTSGEISYRPHARCFSRMRLNMKQASIPDVLPTTGRFRFGAVLPLLW